MVLFPKSESAGTAEDVTRHWPASDHDESQPRYLSADDRETYEADKKIERRLRKWASRDAWRRRFFRPGARLFGVVAVVETVALSLQVAGLPKDTFWATDSLASHIVAAVAIAGVLLLAVVAEAYARVVRERQGDRRLEELARSIARLVSSRTKVKPDHISVHIWQVRDPRLWLVPRWVPYRRSATFLIRRAAFVPERREHEAIAFLPGYGVVGRCWLRRREILADLNSIARLATDAASFYGKLSYEERYRLTFAHVWNTRHFFSIWAYPLFKGPPGAFVFAGAVSVDIQRPGHVDDLRRVADNRSAELNSLLADCASVLRAEADIR